MKDERRPARNAAATSSTLDGDGSDARGRSAVAELDDRLELRERLVAIIDLLDEEQPRDALLNLRFLLMDLDRLAA